MAAQGNKAASDVWLLQLTDDGAPKIPSGYIYLPPPTDPAYILRFQIEGTSSICRQGSLWVNIPAPGEPFRRTEYRKYEQVTRYPQTKPQLTLWAVQASSGFQQNTQH